MNTLNLILILVVIGLSFWVWSLKKKIRILEDGKMELAEGNGIGKINKEKVRIKEERKNQILKILGNRGRVNNNDVQEILGVSDSTATRYLEELEREGKIFQKGAGSGIYYEFKG